MTHYEIELETTPGAAAAALAAAAEEHDALWEPEGASGGRLTLPVVYGLRHGIATGRIELVRLGAERTRVVWEEERSQVEVHRSAVAILCFAAVPALVTVAWPFYPALFALVPFAAVTGLLAWWLVVSRLRSSGPREFLDALRDRGDRGDS